MATTEDNCNWSTKCCGCCCDMRQSVIAVNMISIGMLVMAIVLQIVGSFDTELDDDIIQEINKIFVPVFIAVNIVFAIFYSLGIYGAYKNKIWPVVISLGGHIAYFGISVFMVDLAGVILSLFFVYPHIFFIRELKQKRNSTSSNGNANANVTDNVEMAEIGDDDVTVKEDFDDMSEIDVNHNYDDTKDITVTATIV
ncbi:hypothetical protein FRACYDRAFT_232247 [Fragilariopsis cylindrus CCMP1102]|uniref:Lysosomal-associated transmembrane protein 4B n=1 Tax=Fragilariopsis cylindrus CCMP1102 TaxID=635003 RepID=A0A1E7FWA9_9STRA|nr:hypothetical protein FRACYDRAFT_232247 [Fragilariopsis cylindrus CCMP1102]|eukprot:OEU22093.1 hypothetical protein FRACYDRAFT_232247 [Fragilariopsis cylindrus CCMP1102]